MRLTKFNSETGVYEYVEKAKTLAEYREQRKAVIQKLGEYEDIVSYVTPDPTDKQFSELNKERDKIWARSILELSKIIKGESDEQR